MKRLILSLFFVFAIIGTSFAQQEVVSCFNYKKAGDYQRAIEAGKKAVKLYPRNVDAHFCLGDAYRLVGELNLALQSMKEAERLAVEKDKLMFIYNNMGLIFGHMGDLDNALFYYNKSLNLTKELGNKREEATALSNIAGIFKKKGDLDKALSYYEESLRLITDEKNKATTYNNIALIYNQKGDYQKAISYLKKAIAIHERHGDYHGLARTLLNLGNTYREAKDFVQAEEYLTDGLKMILKIGDKYWEATAYKYLGWLYKDKGDIKNAREYLTKAYNLYESIGAKSDALNALFSLIMLEVQKPKNLYAGIEIGSKGVKAIVLQLSQADEVGFYNVEEKIRRSTNTTIISDVQQTGFFADDAIEETAQAVKELFSAIKDKHGVSEGDIFIAASSAISKVKNKDRLAEKIQKLTGKKTVFIDKEDEVYYNIIGAIPQKHRSSALSIDIGSGNTKIGYIEGSDGSTRAVSVEIPFGTVSFTDLIQKNSKTVRDIKLVADKLRQSKIMQTLQKEVQRKPAIKNRQPVFMVGGIIWAMTTLMYPERQDSFVKLTLNDIEKFYTGIETNPEKLLAPDLSKIKDDDKKSLASRQIQSVKDTFSTENLLAGASILKGIADGLNIKGKEIYFSRYGSWLWGYIASTGVYFEDEKKPMQK